MRFVSTGAAAPPIPLSDALFAGQAPDGGLYMPERLPTLGDFDLARLPRLSLAERSVILARHLFGDAVPEQTLGDITASALDFEIPLVELEDGLSILELFHGPTLAFKDVGARFMARLMAHFLDQSDRELLVLAATSGDTGSAVAHAFFGLPGTRVCVLFPRGQVSLPQQKLFTTLGGNVAALSVDGTFDDCQRLARQALGDDELRRRHLLTSGNSINVGRLLPQTFYYFHLWGELRLRHPGSRDQELVIAVPSGNFGNLTAGLLAKRLGLPCTRFVAATNVNDVVPRYLESGVYSPLPSRRTLSNAMDVGDPSNFRRILHLYDGELDRLRADLAGAHFTDEETTETIRDGYRRYAYVLEPHSAIGLLGARHALAERPFGRSVAAFLGTAHPAKFADTVTAAIDRPIDLPQALADHLTREETVIEIDATYDALRDHLGAL